MYDEEERPIYKLSIASEIVNNSIKSCFYWRFYLEFLLEDFFYKAL